MNIKTVALTDQEYQAIIGVMQSGFTTSGGRIVKPNARIATALTLEANLGIRISDVLRLRLSDIIRDGDRYRLNITEKKTGKKREFTVPVEIFAYIQNYALEHGISPVAKLFDISERAVQLHLQLVCEHLDLENVSSHSFRKYFASSIYTNNNYNIELVRVLLQHSSVTTTQRYIGLQRKEVEKALQNHIKLV